MATANHNKERLQLTEVRDGITVKTRVFNGKEIVIGRQPGADLPVEDLFVSTSHCRIEKQGSEHVLVDSSSTNGVKVNEEKVEEAVLHDGDRIVIGKTELRVKFVNGSSAPANHDEPSIGALIKDTIASNPLTNADLPRGEILSQAVSATEPVNAEAMRPTSGTEHIRAELNDEASMSNWAYEEDTLTMSLPDLVDEEEDDEYERNFSQPFSLVRNYLKRDPNKGSSRQGHAALEVLHCFGDTILSADNYTHHRSISLATEKGKRKTAKLIDSRGILFYFDEFSEGYVKLKGKKRTLKQLYPQAEPCGRGGIRRSIRLGESDYACLNIGDKAFYFRLGETWRLPVRRLKFNLSPEMVKVIGVSFLTHVIALAIIGYFVARADDRLQEKLAAQDRFVQLDLKQLKPPTPVKATPTPAPKKTPEPVKVAKKKSKPKPKIKPKPKPKPKLAKKKPKPKKKRIVKRAKPKNTKIKKKVVLAKKAKPKRSFGRSKVKKSRGIGNKRGRKVSKPVQLANVGVLGALGGLNPKTKNASMASAITNLKAVKSRGGAQTFSVSGLQGKVANDDVIIQRIGDLNTKGSGSGQRNYGVVGSVGGKRGGGQGVGGLVVGDDPIIEPAIRGSLTADQIMKVIQEHLSEVSYCYEKALRGSPSLAGKVRMLWTIAPSGRVTTAKVKSSTLRHGGVQSCVVRNIKTWRFPKPKGGGVVDVNFPFVFDSASF